MDQFGIFAKYWEPGKVKTRLAASIGPAAAARLYQAFLRTLLVRFQDIAERRVVVYSPEDRRPQFTEFVSKAWELEPQGGGDLGARMKHYFQQSLGRGAKRVVLIGSDSPTLPVAHVEAAFEELTDHDVVLGPSPDGGYYLVGLARRVSAIFDDVAWSSDRVWSQTVAHLERAGSAYAVLPQWDDIDEADDLTRLQTELARSEPDDAAFTALAEEVELALGGAS